MTRRQAVAITESLIVDALRRMTPGQRAALLALAAPSDPAPASTAGGKREARVKLAKQYGYTGSDDDIAIRSRGLRRVLREMSWDADDIQTFNDMDQGSKDKVLRLALETLDKPPAPTPTPAATPTPTPAATPALGLQADGSFNVTDAQLRDPAFCFENQKHLADARIVEAGAPPAPAPAPGVGASPAPTGGKIRVTQEQLRDPAWCFSPEGEATLKAASDRVVNLPVAQVGEVFEVV
jgi:hypothetical protein